MKTLVAVVAALAVALSANLAAAYVVVVTTAIPIPTAAAAQNPMQLVDVVTSAIRDVLDHAIAFTPTVVTLEEAKVVGDRLYLMLLVADEDGQSTIDALSKSPEPESEPSDQGGRDASAPSTL